MADSVELQISVTSIKRVDPYVKDILATSTHVALYKFNPVSNEWEKTETEGALFVYSRNGQPFHSMMILNRLNTKNLIEPIIKEFDYQMQTPFLLYRNSKNKIYGIWFFNAEECVSITYLLESLMEGLKEKSNEKNKKKEKSVDILSMLTKAQEDFNKTPSKNETQPQFSSTPRAPDMASQSVMDFFAKASSKSVQKPAVQVDHSANILQRLMSNPAHSVEHIEKQQRSITPQEQVPLRPKTFMQADRRSVPITFKQNKNENVVSFYQVESPQQGPAHGVSPLASLFMQAQNPPADDVPEVSGTSPLAHLLETPQKPALMPPMMFASSSLKEKNDSSQVIFSSALEKSQQQPAVFERNEAPLTISEKFKNIEPLTKNQMLQALNYLLRTDTDFVVKLHEAYVNSFTEMLSSSNTGN